jgi:hypothetical protein
MTNSRFIFTNELFMLFPAVPSVPLHHLTL